MVGPFAGRFWGGVCLKKVPQKSPEMKANSPVHFLCDHDAAKTFLRLENAHWRFCQIQDDAQSKKVGCSDLRLMQVPNGASTKTESCKKRGRPTQTLTGFCQSACCNSQPEPRQHFTRNQQPTRPEPLRLSARLQKQTRY